jgi:hypothetical protein
MSDRMTVLEEIIKEVSAELYQKWYNAMPEEEKNESSSEALAKNAGETTFFVVQTFMNKFNSAAEELKDK